MTRRTLTPLLAILAAVAPLSAAPSQAAPLPQLSLEERMLLRCSAAFALVANRQQQGEPAALAYPPLGDSGREFFVRASARLIDEAGLTREALALALSTEAQLLTEEGALAAVMPACLDALAAARL